MQYLVGKTDFVVFSLPTYDSPSPLYLKEVFRIMSRFYILKNQMVKATFSS